MEKKVGPILFKTHTPDYTHAFHYGLSHPSHVLSSFLHILPSSWSRELQEHFHLHFRWAPPPKMLFPHRISSLKVRIKIHFLLYCCNWNPRLGYQENMIKSWVHVEIDLLKCFWMLKQVFDYLNWFGWTLEWFGKQKCGFGEAFPVYRRSAQPMW